MDEIESQDVETEAEDTEEEEPEEQSEETTTEESEDDTTEETPKPKKREETPQQKKARLTRELKRLEKANPELADKSTEQKPKSKTEGDLSDAVLDYFELKGITEQDDIEIIKSVMERTGKSHREVLKDDYVVSKLDANQKARDVKGATPSGTKRAGQGNADSVDFWFAKYSASWELPKNMPKGMAEKLVDRRYASESSNSNPYE